MKISLKSTLLKILFILIPVIIILADFPAFGAETGGTTVEFWGSVATMEMSVWTFKPEDMRKVVEEIQAQIKKQTGIKVRLHTVAGVNQIFQKFKEGKADFGYLSRADYFAARRIGIPITVMMAPMFQNWDQDQSCLWTRKENQDKTLGEFRGAARGMVQAPETDFKNWPRVLSFTNLWQYFTFRWILAQNGQDMPIEKFCGSLQTELETQDLGLAALAVGAIDLTVASRLAYNVLSITDQRMKNLVPLYCGPSGPVAPVVRRKDMDPKTVDQFVKAAAALDLSAVAVEFQSIFKMTSYTPVTEDDYKALETWFNDCIKKGYLEEIRKLKAK